MKQILVLPLLLAAIAVAAMIHSVRVNTFPIEDNFDRLSAGLKGIDKVLPQGTNVSFLPIGMPVEDILFCNFLLAPRSGRSTGNRKPDTVLVIYSQDTKDSLLHAVMHGNVIWSNSDNKYKYYLNH